MAGAEAEGRRESEAEGRRESEAEAEDERVSEAEGVPLTVAGRVEGRSHVPGFNFD